MKQAQVDYPITYHYTRPLLQARTIQVWQCCENPKRPRITAQILEENQHMSGDHYSRQAYGTMPKFVAVYERVPRD